MKQIQLAWIVGLLITIMMTGCVSQTSRVMPVPESKKSKGIKQEAPEIMCNLKESKPRPSWIDHPPNSNHVRYGVGAAPMQTPVTKQIQAAKILAMRDISQQIMVHLHSLYEETQTDNDTNIQSRVRQESSSLLRGIKYVDQWNDVKTCTIYVLASVALK